MSRELRDYQQKTITDAREAIRKGYKAICLQGATGSGKSIIFTEILSSINNHTE
jgi:superfamily II DNA or RNA helicase